MSFFSRCILLSSFISFWGLVPLLAQHGYEASWKAGLFAIDQNPAVIVSSPQKGEFLLGALNLSAQNNLFETNDLEIFLPHTLFGNLTANLTNLAFITNTRQQGLYANANSNWNASIVHRIQGPGGFWQLKINDNMKERGLLRIAASLRMERHELIQINDMDAELGKGYANRFASNQMTGISISDDFFSARMQEWDAGALSFGVQIGKGLNLINIAVGAKLLSAGSFMDFRAYGTQLQFEPDNRLEVQADSVSFTYNPSFASAANPFGRRRYGNFENSWGIVGELGIVYQVINQNRLPKFEIGVSIQDFGRIQYWNLSNITYQIPAQTASYESFTSGFGVDLANRALQNLTIDTLHNATGITEQFPLLLTAHAKMNLGSKGWGLQFRGDFRRETVASSWQTFLRATLGYEGKKASIFFPVSTTLILPSSSSIEWRPRVGVFLTLGDKIVLGSNDVLTTMFYSSTRQGVAASHVFLGLHFPVE